MFREKLTRLFAFRKKRWARITGKVLWISAKTLTVLLVLFCFVAGGAAFGYVSAMVKDDPVRTKDAIMHQMQDDSLTSFVYFNDDKVLGQLRTDEDRRLATLSEIPQMMRDAVVAIEDAGFYQHHGVSVNGFMRAVKEKVLNEPVQTGGSTITQQLARRVFLSLDRDYSRKFKEILLSLRLERFMSKDEILTAYLNKVPYGNGASGYNLYGIKAAAKGIFNIDDLSKLNLAQEAYLAGLPQQPSTFSNFTSKGVRNNEGISKAIERQHLVLESMLREKYINEDQYKDALSFDIKSSLSETREKAYNTYPFLMAEAERQAVELLVKAQNPQFTVVTDKNQNAYNNALKDMQTEMYRGGYHVYTTIDKTVYDAMQDIAANPKNFTKDDPKKGIEQIGAVMIDSKTGAVLGMIEGRDYDAEQLNHATQAYRQPGSTMKTIAAYLPALEKGAIQPASVIDDVPVILKDGSKGFHIPENWDNDYHGLVTARKAFNQSYNIPAIKLFLNDVGIKNAWAFARKLGISSLVPQDDEAQTGVIGGLYKGVSVLEMTGAYEAVANKGNFNDPYMIRKIVDSNGKTIYEHERKPTNVFSEETAYLMTDMMRTVVTDGTATTLKKDFKHYGKVPIVGKTGSTQDDADAWFIGYTPDITLGVWAGYDQPVYKLSDTGKQRAKSIWALVMDAAIDKKPDLFPTASFTRPAGIVDMTVSTLSGKLPNELVTAAGKLQTDIFNKKYAPTTEDDVMVQGKFITYKGVNYLAQPGTPDEFVQQDKVVIRRKESISALLKQISDLMEKLPQDKRKPIDGYIPLDADMDAPQEVDPRVDDGRPPAPPGDPLLTHTGDTYRLSFAPSGSADVVGYRLYRSVNGGPFQQERGQIVLAGNEPIFKAIPASGGFSVFYVTAVDVGGHESAPGTAISGDGTAEEMNHSGSGSGAPGGEAPGGSLPGGGSPSGSGNNPGASPSPGASPAGPSPAGGKPAAGAPSAPSGIRLKQTGLTVSLSWKANAAGERVNEYRVYYSDKEKGVYQMIGSTPGNVTDFNYYSPIQQGYFRIAAVNDLGESAKSAAVKLN